MTAPPLASVSFSSEWDIELLKWQQWIQQEDFSALWNSAQENRIDSSEAYYRLGNLLYEAGYKKEAERAWSSAANTTVAHTAKKTEESTTSLVSPLASKKTLWKIVSTALISLASIYLIIFTLFPRQDDAMQLMMQALNQNQNRSFWDKWWDKGRPSHRSPQTLTDTLDVWSIINRTLKELTDTPEKSRTAGGASSKALRWLQEYRSRPFDTQQPVDYYLLVGKGFLNAGKYDEAISIFQEGIGHASTKQHRGELYRQLGTTYYYGGYQLQANGLAQYDLQKVELSLKAYEQALANGVQDGYLLGNMGWGYYLLGDYSRSLEYSKSALATAPELKYVEMNVGITYLRMQQYQDSFRAYQRTVSYHPDVNEYEGGKRDLKELEKEFPGRYPFINFALGYLEYEQEHYIQSEQYFQRFLSSSFPKKSWKSKAHLWISKMRKKNP